jgi:hypothetical protein
VSLNIKKVKMKPQEIKIPWTPHYPVNNKNKHYNNYKFMEKWKWGVPKGVPLATYKNYQNLRKFT